MMLQTGFPRCPNPLTIKKRDEVLTRMLKTPHKPHVAKKLAKKRPTLGDRRGEKVQHRAA
jgi:hypothetical protein